MKAEVIVCLRLSALASGVLLSLTSAHAGPKAVYTTTNAVAGNEVVVFDRAANGTLDFSQAVATGGLGTGGGLGNQGAVVLANADDEHWLLAVNAGSNDVSVFRVENDGLTLTDVEPSGGMLPVSVTAHGNLVYVLNGMGAGNIAGFLLDGDGELSPLPGSTQPLSGAAATAPAQIEFTPDGQWLVVTEKSTNLIDIYPVDDDGLAGAPNSQPSVGMTPFGFAFTDYGDLIVSEAFGGMPDLSAVSSYQLCNGQLDVISPSVGTTETAACWIVITNNNRFAYTTNTASGTISGYKINQSDGALTLLDADGVTASTGMGTAPTDLALSNNSKFLYALNSATGEIAAFKVKKSNGELTSLQTVGGLPANATGLAAR
jgi:6-phosphogluconolactonase